MYVCMTPSNKSISFSSRPYRVIYTTFIGSSVFRDWLISRVFKVGVKSIAFEARPLVLAAWLRCKVFDAGFEARRGLERSVFGSIF